ncbi:MAG TPA: transglycosylase SLT domain-containing protein [Gemmatimonadota bacterium]|nr:transglycosylase SLT domain-containing protein [Gemmatimonadota bacterium]
MALIMGFAALAADAEVPDASPRRTAPAGTLASLGWVGAVDVVALAAVAEADSRLTESAERLARRFGVGRKLAGIIYAEALRAGIEPAMAFGVIAQESGFDPSAVGSSGERGLMQIKPSTARAYDARITPDALLRPETNLRLGLRHLKREVEYFGDPILGLMSYHMGRARLERELADGLAPRDRYVERVLSSCGGDCA